MDTWDENLVIIYWLCIKNCTFVHITDKIFPVTGPPSETPWRPKYRPWTKWTNVGLCGPSQTKILGTPLRGDGSYVISSINTHPSIFSARWDIYISRLCYDVSVRLSVHLSVTEVHWRIIANLGFTFRYQFTAYCGRDACGREGRDHRREEWRDHLALC